MARTPRTPARACSTAPSAGLGLDEHQAAAYVPVAGLQVTAATQPRPPGRGDRAGPRPVLATGEASERERDEPATADEIVAREHGGDRVAAHRGPPRRARARGIVGVSGSVRGRGSLCPSPSTDPELRLSPPSPQPLVQLARGSKLLRGKFPAGAVARATEPPAVDRSSPRGHPLGAVKPRGERHAQDEHAAAGPQTDSWTRPR
jgi:hypothetical protein